MGDPSDFHDAEVARVRPVTDELVAVILRDGEAAGAHAVPGQFVDVRLSGTGATPFAIASDPSSGDELELLVKRGNEVADALFEGGAGLAVEVSAPKGRGFPIDDFEGHDVLLFATGSGISGIRPVVHHVLRRRDRFGRVVVFYGARTEDAFAYVDEIPEWERGGVEVVRVVSRPSSGWRGRTGWVQSALDDLAPSLDHAVACLCGVEAMIESVGTTLARGGLPRSRILTNL